MNLTAKGGNLLRCPADGSPGPFNLMAAPCNCAPGGGAGAGNCNWSASPNGPFTVTCAAQAGTPIVVTTYDGCPWTASTPNPDMIDLLAPTSHLSGSTQLYNITKNERCDVGTRGGIIEFKTAIASIAYGPIGSVFKTIVVNQTSASSGGCLAASLFIVGYSDGMFNVTPACYPVGCSALGDPAWDGTFPYRRSPPPLSFSCEWKSRDYTVNPARMSIQGCRMDNGSGTTIHDIGPGNWQVVIDLGVAIWIGNRTGDGPAGVYTRTNPCYLGPAFITISE